MIRSALFGILCWFAGPAWADCTLDSAFVAGQYNALSSSTLTLSTNGTNRAVHLYFEHETFDGSAAPALISVTSPNLTWALRTRYTHPIVIGIFGQAQEVWWANAPTQLTSEVVTFVLDKTVGNGDVLQFSVVLANPITPPFDPNASLVKRADDFSGVGSTPEIPGVSTTNAPDLLLSYCGKVGAIGVCGGSAAGWTKIQSTTNSDQTSSIMYSLSATPQTNVIVPTGAGGPTNYWSGMADAIGSTGACGPVPPPTPNPPRRPFAHGWPQ